MTSARRCAEAGAQPAARRRPPVPTGDDMPRIVSVLVFLRDRGIFLLWGLLIVVFAFWCVAVLLHRRQRAARSRNAAAITAIFAAGVGIGIMTGVLDLSLPGTAALASCVCGWLLTNGYADLARPGGRRSAAASWSASSTA